VVRRTVLGIGNPEERAMVSWMNIGRGNYRLTVDGREVAVLEETAESNEVTGVQFRLKPNHGSWTRVLSARNSDEAMAEACEVLGI
jgi:hypothetical protein